MRASEIALVVIACAGGACSENRWGGRCEKDADCEDSALVCVKGGEENITGFCRYAAGELRCGSGTILEGGQCVPDPAFPPGPTCGPGTVEDDGRCVLAVDAGLEPDSGAPGEDGGPPSSCPSQEDACAGSSRCVAGQVLDIRTGDPVSPDDDLSATVFDPFGGPKGLPLMTVPVGENGCFVARDLPATAQQLRSLVVNETQQPADPDRVVMTVNLAGDGQAEGACCDSPVYVTRKADEMEWNVALGLAPESGIEATGTWIGFIRSADGQAVAGATLTNGGTDELRARYFTDDMSAFEDGATTTGGSGAWLVIMTAPPLEIANFSARDGAYPTVLFGQTPGSIGAVLIQTE